MLNWLRNKKPPEIVVDILNDIPRYPPFAEGLPFATSGQLMATQKDLLNTLRATIGVGPDLYNKLYLPIIENYAAYAHLLPASEAHHHRGAGGLFRHGLEVAWQASLMFAGRVVHGELTSETRKRIESRLQLAVFIAALCHDAGKCMFDLAVSNRSGDINWDPHETSLLDWLSENQMERYFVHWQGFRKHRAHEHFSTLLIQKIVPNDSFSYMRAGTEEITSSLFEIFLTDNYGSRYAPLIHDIVSKADQYSVERDLKQERFSPQDDALGVPVARYVIDAIRRLIQTKKWQINKPGARVWVSDEGTFIVWNAAIDEIFEILNEDNVAGIPHDADKLAKILIERDLAKLYIDGEGKSQLYWRVTPLFDRHTASITFNGLRLSHFSLISDQPAPAFVKLKDFNENDTIENNEITNIESVEQKIKTAATVTSISAADLLKQINNPKTRKSTPSKEKSVTPKIEPVVVCENIETPTEDPSSMPGTTEPVVNESDTAKKYPLVDKLLKQAYRVNKIQRYKGCIALIFPEDCKLPNRETADIMEELTMLDVLQPNPDNPMRKVIQTQINKSKTNVIVFTQDISDHYQQLKSLKPSTQHNKKPAQTKNPANNNNKEIRRPANNKVNNECKAFIHWLQKHENDSDINIDNEGITFAHRIVTMRYCKETGKRLAQLSKSIEAHPGFTLDKDKDNTIKAILRCDVNG